MGGEEWMSRLRTFAALGVWPSEAGNRPAPCQKKCDTTTRTLILFCITRSNIWSDSNTWANTFQAHFDVGITVTTSSASALPLPTTLPATATTARPSGPPSMTPAAPEQQLVSLFLTSYTVTGVIFLLVILFYLIRVDSLAEYLVGLRTETGQTLNNQQASTIIALWQNLLPYDQQRVAYAAGHQVRLTTGRFRCSKKKPDFTPGVESMTHCVLASTGSPAQWPNSCRLVESIFVKLCDIHKSPKKQGNYALTRWTLILRDYSKIRQLVLARPPTSVPLASKYCRTGSGQEEVCSSGPTSPSSTVCPPEAASSEAVVPSAGTSTYICPFACCPRPHPCHWPICVFDPTSPCSQTNCSCWPPCCSSTRPEGLQSDGGPKKFVKCHQPRNKETGHSQYYGHIYCPQNTDMPLDQWLEEMRRKRTEKK
ncbi:hypothetical protein SKAU_G00018870 [Synaphobranchus kaupii]|uniref:Uncharacterized protein n=1 Tax=Synaphobranchus kaupii TaxID=118154 RepID=A0A9Q1GBH8_SYNKA|nr:hypothetical protein SKAU_G00018870 [Synaphobranchus kaupii]